MQRLLFHPLGIISITVLVGAIWLSLWHNQTEIRGSRVLVTSLEGDLASRRQEVADLQHRLDQAGTPLAQERLIRDQLLMQKPGEYILQIPEIPQEKLDLSSSNSAKSPWEEWRGLLLHSN